MSTIPAAILFILGGILWVLRLTDTFSFLFFWMSLVCCILAGVILSRRTGGGNARFTLFLPMLIFFIWFFFFDGNYDPSVSIPFAIGTVLVLGTISIARRETLVPELLGIIPVIFFFLDIGFIPLLVEYLGLPITDLVQNLVLYMPWWMLFGLYTLPQGRTPMARGLHLTLQIAGVLYILAVVIVPAIPDFGYDIENQLVPSAEEFEEAQQSVRSKIPAYKTSPIYLAFQCFGTTSPTCIEDKKLQAQLEHVCEEETGLNFDDLDNPTDQKKWNACIEKNEKILKSGSGRVDGDADRTIRLPTKAKLLVDKKLFPLEYDPNLPFPFEIDLENPRAQLITAQVTCSFEGRRDAPDVRGVIRGPDTVKFSDLRFKASFLCAPEGVLDGTYSAHFNLTLKELATKSRLQRVFIGEKTPEEKDKLWREEISKVVTVKESAAPNEFARLNFDIGHALGEPMIEQNEFRPIVLKSNIENTGSGELLKVHRYKIEVDDFTIDSDSASTKCKEDRDPPYNDIYSRNYPLPSCVVEAPSHLQNPSPWQLREFEAGVVYDYRITRDETITIEPRDKSLKRDTEEDEEDSLIVPISPEPREEPEEVEQNLGGLLES